MDAALLSFTPPLAAAPLVRMLHGHAVPGMEMAHADGRHTRVVRGRNGPTVVTVDLAAAPAAVGAEMRLATAREAEARAEAWRPHRAHALMHLWTREVFS